MPRPDTGTRQKLIDTAKDLIWTSSYGAVSVDDICKHAGVKKGSFYHYFPSKQDLALTAMEEHFRQDIEPDLVRIFTSDMPFSDQIDAFTEALLKNKRESLAQYGRVCGCPIAALGSEMIGQEEQAITAKAEEMFGRCRDLMGQAIRKAMDTGVIPQEDVAHKSLEIHNFMTGLMIMTRIHNSLEGLERDLNPGLRRILGLDNATHNNE